MINWTEFTYEKSLWKWSKCSIHRRFSWGVDWIGSDFGEKVILKLCRLFVEYNKKEKEQRENEK